jgi:hypothetical protein
MKTWWMRVGEDDHDEGSDDYGRWVPTGQTDRQVAEDYAEAYGIEGRVIEWALL